MMIPVRERVVEVFGEMNDALRMAFHKTLEGLKTLAGRIFLNPWFVIGTMPFANQFNSSGILVIHFRPLIWKKKNQTCDCESGSVRHFKTSRSSYIYKAPFWTFVPCESSSRFPPFLKVLLLSKQRCRKIRLKPMIRINNTGLSIVKTYKGVKFSY
jgi:hypothetical protein